MSKESGGFLRKVARFVSNPTTDWTELDTPSAEAVEGDYAKTEIKAMIERKRRNDFVRKRELDMLRKIRREGLSPDNALALGIPSNLDPDSRPQNGTRSDVTVKAKIDEIEQQMVGSGSRTFSQTSSSAPVRTTSAGLLHDAAANAVTAPGQLASGNGKLSRTKDTVPKISKAVLDAARASLPGVAGTEHASPHFSNVLESNSLHGGLEVHEAVDVTHDPDLDEAVIAFANADFDQCERCLMTLVHPDGPRYEQQDTWLVLFDFYRALDLQQKFDSLAVSFAHQFGVSAPQWYSIPQKVADFIARSGGAAAGLPSDADAPDTEAGPDAMLASGAHVEGWIAPAEIDAESVAQLRVEVLQMPRPWTIEWSRVVNVSPEGAGLLGQVVRQWAQEKQNLTWKGAEHLLYVLGELSPTGSRDTDPAYWMLRLDILRLCNRPEEFDEVAIDYCVTYERSPPSWEPTRCTVTMIQDAISPHTRSLSRVSDVTNTFVESQLHPEVEFIQVASLNLSGQLVGDITSILNQLEYQVGAAVSLNIDCEHLLRVDFIAAGDLLNWVLARRTEDRDVIFNRPHRLVAMFFGAMGINEHAKVKLRTV